MTTLSTDAQIRVAQRKLARQRQTIGKLVVREAPQNQINAEVDKYEDILAEYDRLLSLKGQVRTDAKI